MKKLENRNGETNLPAIFLRSTLEKCLYFYLRWRFAVHGCIDGFSGTIIYVNCATNNKAVTVALISMETVKLYGWLSCVRSDCGVENVDVAR